MGWMMNRNKNTKAMLAELREEYPIDYETRTLQNNKALLSTAITDGMYYEVTYNGDKNEVYFDVYKHIRNREIKLGDE